MHILDWILLSIPLLIVCAIGLYTQRYMKSVADFMSGSRLAGRYILTVAKGEQAAGAVVFIALFELTARAGFTFYWWQWIQVPAVLLVAISGFVIYRFRETRAMTLAQFFELRYSKPFRLFTGMLGFLAGVINFGIIPAVSARFFVYFLGMPPEVTILSFTVATYIPIMVVLLAITLYLTLTGGLLTVMITDCVEGILSQLFYLIIIAVLLVIFNWTEIAEVLSNRPPGQSLLNPFDSAAQEFNLIYVLMSMFVTIYGTMAWQNASAYNAAASSAHESRMAGILGRWREYGKVAVVALLAVCAITFLEHPHFATQAAQAHETINGISQPQIRTQMQIPVALAYLLPIGVKGILCAIFLMGTIGGNATHLHSWGGILVQDVFVPLRKTQFGPKQHIWMLRLSITAVALFAFLFGCFFKQTEYILMWWNVTMALYVGGAGAAIIGGLYWKKGTTSGAWSALLTGSILSTGGILAKQVYGDAFPLNGMEVSFYSTLLAIAVYIFVSLLTHREDYDIERLLHRGRYASSEPLAGETSEPRPRRNFSWSRLIGFDNNFTLGDKWIAAGLFAWGMFWFSVILIGSIWNLISPWPTAVWATYWHIAGVGIPIVMTFVTGVWFTWGGVCDIRKLFQRLREQKVNHLDDGTVVDHQNLDEVAVVHEPPVSKPAEGETLEQISSAKQHSER